MKSTRAFSSLALMLIAALSGPGNAAFAADVDLRLSSREAWVGMPIVLQLSINDAADYEQPTIPEIDGCDIRSAGAPSQSSQTTIINGRRTDSRSIVMQFLITPRREGTFDLPPFSFKVDGRAVTTEKLRFVASKSQTGDLLFVEIEGAKDRVYVGQPLELKLKIWIKPFRDPARNITLSEANMWQMISEQTSWGSFLNRMQELANGNQRPGGTEVLRDDGQGNERSYYLYEMSTTVYPNRPGKIDADDVQIVVNYPVELGKARDPFGDFFGDRGSGGSSPLSQMLGDDFFSSPFGNRLTVSATRPIVGEAKVDSTEVMPVPTEGRPADYGGAVGRYSIVTQATPATVVAGDPITLNIGISGTGPMELVQAPPVSELPQLTKDFQVADQSLAGFVQDDAKLFSTTIRPRHEGITQIPGIPFSFFDPDTGKYETVVSEPISITVDKSESLSLDSIIGKPRGSEQNSMSAVSDDQKSGLDFTNDNSPDVLLTQAAANDGQWWWLVTVVSPLVWIGTVIACNRTAISSRFPSFQSAISRSLKLIDRAEGTSGIVKAMTDYIADCTRQKCSTAASAIGALRVCGMTQAAIDVEEFFLKCDAPLWNGAPLQSLDETRQQARELLKRLEADSKCVDKSRVRRSSRASKHETGVVRSVGRVSMLLIAVCVQPFSASDVNAAQMATVVRTAATSRNEGPGPPGLSTAQQQTILTEAGDLYSRGTDLAKKDSAKSAELFGLAARKYQMLVDSGLRNAVLYKNLGNARLQSNQLGKAIASYERALQLTPDDRQLALNLQYANSLVKVDSPGSDGPVDSVASGVLTLPSILELPVTFNRNLVNLMGQRVINRVLVVSSVLFWGLLTVRAAGWRFPAWQFSILPLLLLTTSLTSVCLASVESRRAEDAVVVADRITLRAGDGEQFDSVISVTSAQGHRVQIIAMRNDWIRVRTRKGHIGWLKSEDVEELKNNTLQ